MGVSLRLGEKGQISIQRQPQIRRPVRTKEVRFLDRAEEDIRMATKVFGQRSCAAFGAPMIKKFGLIIDFMQNQKTIRQLTSFDNETARTQWPVKGRRDNKT